MPIAYTYLSFDQIIDQSFINRYNHFPQLTQLPSTWTVWQICRKLAKNCPREKVGCAHTHMYINNRRNIKTRTLVRKPECIRSEGGRSNSGDMVMWWRGGRTMSTVGSFGIARLRPSRAAYAEHAAEAAPPALRRAPSTATDVPIIVSRFQHTPFQRTVFTRI